ncbi:MAG: hypothetical protein JEZ14_09355 [Marinilabiliaceae bacterium]|nr:hypothetical protein [Marinilabiliaceae bacterium]
MKKKLAVIGALVIMLLVNVVNVIAQDNKEKNLPCLEKVYSVTDGEVLLDCKPEDSKYISCDRFFWKVKGIKRNGQAGVEFEGCVKKKGDGLYLLPQKIFQRVGDEEVFVEYSQFSNNGRGYSIQYRIKVIED